jgi:hypothetical protein
VKKYSQSGSKGKSEFHRVSFRCAAVNSLKEVYTRSCWVSPWC